MTSVCNVTTVCLVASEQKLFEINEIWVTLDKGQRMTLASGTCISLCMYLVYYSILTEINLPIFYKADCISELFIKR